MTFMEAVAEGAFPIHENTPNIYMEQPVYKGEDTQGLLEHAAHTVEGSFGTSRQPHLTVEPDVVLAYPQDGGVVIQCKGQYLYGNIAQMAPAIGLPKEKVRIIGNPAGGSFGYSMSPGNTALGGGLRAGAGCAGFPGAQLRRTPAHDGQAFPRVRQWSASRATKRES